MAKNSNLNQGLTIDISSMDLVSMNLYPNNKPSHFRIKLASSLSLLGGDWEVALKSIQIPCTWRNVIKPIQFAILIKPTERFYSERFLRSNQKRKNNEFLKVFQTSSRFRDFDETADGLLHYILPAGFYQSAFEIGKKIANDLTSHLKDVGISICFDELPNGEYYFNVYGAQIAIYTDDPTILRDALGFELRGPAEYDNFNIYAIPIFADRVSKRQENQKLLEVYNIVDVYCSAIESRITSSSLAPLIISLGRRDENAQIIDHKPATAHYYPVSDSHISEIEVKLTHRTGEEVQFKGGARDEVKLDLHFRKVNPLRNI